MTVTKIHPCDKHWTGPIPEGCADCKAVHMLRTTIDNYPGGRLVSTFVYEIEIDADDYDPENYTLGSLVWDAWTVKAWPLVKHTIDTMVAYDHDDMKVLVTFDGETIADEHPNHVTEDLFTASWVAQHDEPLGRA